MARIRTIKPEFPQSETIGRLSRDARLLFIQLWTVVDDSGRARGNSRILASLLYPFDDDSFSMMDSWIAELELERCVARYQVEGNTYIEILNWLKHQKIDKPSPSRIPPFDESSRILANPRETPATDLVPSTKDLGPRTEDQKPSRGKREVDPRFSEFKGACEAYYKYKTLPMTWDGSESKQLSSLLTANPSLSLDRFQDILRNRLKSTVNHAERPRSWLSRATEYLAGPLDKYGKPLEIDGGNRGTHQSNQSRGVNRVEQQLEELRKAGVSIPPGRPEAGPEQDVPIAGRGDGFGSPGVVLEGIR